MAAHFTREQWQQGALEIDLMLSNTDINDPKLAELAERALTYRLDINRARDASSRQIGGVNAARNRPEQGKWWS